MSYRVLKRHRMLSVVVVAMIGKCTPESITEAFVASTRVAHLGIMSSMPSFCGSTQSPTYTPSIYYRSRRPVVLMLTRAVHAPQTSFTIACAHTGWKRLRTGAMYKQIQ